jgi:hypothetical protein
MLLLSEFSKQKLIDEIIFRGVDITIEITQELQNSQINCIYKRPVKDMNLTKEIIDYISGHSMRIGAVHDLLKSGASMPLIMHREL